MEITEDGVEATEQKAWGQGRERFSLCALRLGLGTLGVSSIACLWLWFRALAGTVKLHALPPKDGTGAVGA